jgi:hypothetical protein
MTKTICHTLLLDLLVICDLLVTITRRSRLRTGGGAPTGSGLRHNFSKKISLGPKNSLERRVSRFPTICAKNQVLNLIIDKVTGLLRRK